MNQSNKFAMAAGGLLTAVFLLFLYGVLVMRIQAGGGYAPYSSFRTDPLGTKALHDALARMPGVETARHTDQYTKLKGGKGDALLILGLQEWVLENQDIKALEIFMSQGGRVVVAFQGRAKKPVMMAGTEEPGNNGPGGNKKTEEKAKPEKTTEPAKAEPSGPTFPENAPPEKEEHKKEPKGGTAGQRHHLWEDLEERWGFEFAYADADIKSLTADSTADRPELPAHLPWHSAMWFENIKSAWRPVYSADGRPVVMERDFGQGQLALLSDSYLFSNEALRKDRETAFILGMTGADRHRVVFDEAHLGVIRQEGVMTLARRYRLTGFLLAGLAAVGLYVWRNATSLAPRVSEEEDGDGAQAGLGAGAALTALLRRSVPAALLARTCWNEWLKSFRGALPPDDPVTDKIEAILAWHTPGRDGGEAIVRQYRAVAAALAERKVHRGTRP